MTRWEYRIEYLTSLGHRISLNAEQLNELGDEGWELVGTLAQNGEEFLVFKRPR